MAFAFGGKSWPVSDDDMNLGTISTGMCLGGIFDLSLGSDVGSGGGNPQWVVGDTFLVSWHGHSCVTPIVDDGTLGVEKRIQCLPF